MSGSGRRLKPQRRCRSGPGPVRLGGATRMKGGPSGSAVARPPLGIRDEGQSRRTALPCRGRGSSPPALGGCPCTACADGSLADGSLADGSLAVKASSGSRSRPRRLGLELEALKAQTPATPSRAHGRLLAAGGVLATARRAAHCDGTQAPSVAPLTAEDLVTSPPPAAAGRPAEMRGGGGHRGPGPSRGRRKRLCDD